MTRELWLQYGALKIKAKAIDEELEMLKDQMLKEVIAEKGDSKESISLKELPGYTFNITTKTAYKYSDYVLASELALKDRKKEEEQKGLYQDKTETPVLVFKEIKQ